MAAFTFSEHAVDAFTLRKAPFRMILSRAAGRLSDPSDIEEIEVAKAMDGLAFDLMEDDQRERVEQAVLEGVRGLRAEIDAGKPLEEPVLPGIGEKLEELQSFLLAHAPH